MPGGISLSEISKLPPRERAKRYRAQAMEARFKATTCTGDLQLSYIRLAGQWEQLALEAEAEAGDMSGSKATPADNASKKESPPGPSSAAG